MAVRVVGTSRSFSWSGSLTAWLFPGHRDAGYAVNEPVTGFSDVEVHCLGGGCAIEYVGYWGMGAPYRTPQPGDPYYEAVMARLGADPLMIHQVFVFTVNVWAGWSETRETSSRAYFATYRHYVQGAPEAAGWLEPLERLVASFSIAYDGLVVKRSWSSHHPPHRQHMHPTDARVEDIWHLTPEAEVTVSCAGLSAWSGPRREDPQYAGLSDAAIGDEPIGDPSLGWSMGRYHGLPTAGEDLAVIAVGGADFTGLERGFDDGIAEDTGFRAFGAGSVLTGRCLGSPSRDGSTWSGTLFPPMDYGWDAECRLFDDDEVLDPPVWAGFVNPSGGGLWYPLSGLPSRPALSLVATSGTVYDASPPYDIHGQNQTFAAEIDEEWALKQWLCCGRAVELETDGGDKVETLHDRYLAFVAPGVQEGTVGRRSRVGQIGTVDRALLPLAPGLTGDPERRWTCEGDIIEAPGSTRARPRFILPADGSGAISFTPVTRFWDRLALIKTPGTLPVWEWIWQLKAVEASEEPEGHPACTAPASWCHAEDVFHFGGAAWLRLRVDRPLDLAMDLTLVLRYSTVEVYDPHYTCGSWRIEEWEYTRSGGRVAYPCSVGVGTQEALVDLLCPAEGDVPRLYIVDELRLEGFRNERDEPLTLELPEMTLIRDPAGGGLVGSIKETWDFLTDWQGMSLSRDGNRRVLEWPDEPWKNDGPERGRGYIQPLQHCPTSGLANLLHTARPLTDLGAAGLVEGFVAQVSGDALVTAPGPGGAPETMITPLMYWAADQPWQLEGQTLPLDAGIVCTQQRIARGIPYRFLIRKVLGGAGWGLLRDREGRRVTQGSEVAQQSWWRLWSRVTAYRDEEGEEIAAPDGLRPVGEWSLEHEGSVDARVDRQGLFRTPGLKPSETRVWNPARGAVPSDHTDTAQVEYLLQIWDTAGSPWAAYDLNDDEDWQALQDDPALASSTTFEIASRRLTPLWVQAGGVIDGGNLVRLRVGTQVITRGGQVWTRVRDSDAWVARHATRSALPLLLTPETTDDLALLDDAAYRSTQHGGEPWSNGLPAGIAPEVAAWSDHPAGRVTDAMVGRGDLLCVAVAVSGATIMALTREDPVVVATLAGDAAGAWPWLTRRSDGRWQIGVFEAGTYREWLSARLDGTAWEPGEEQVIGDAGDLTANGHWRGRDGAELVAGLHRSGVVNVFWRGGVGLPWQGPYLQQAAPTIQPYAYLRAAGGCEVGWLIGDTWQIWRADHPAGDWIG